MSTGVGWGTGRWVAALCWVAVALDGFDLVVLGAVTPALLEYEAWGLTAPRIGAITSYGLIGMMIGALGIGTLADVIGRVGAIRGPILGGLLLGAGLAVPWGFYAFALVGLLGAVFVFAVPRSPADEARGTGVSAEAATR